MATPQSESHVLFLDTRHSVRPDLPYDTEWNLSNAISANLDDYKLSVQTVQIANLVYPVNRFNDQIYFTENGGGTITTALDRKNYDGNELATVLAAKMTAATTVAETYNGSYDVFTKKITISAVGATAIQFVDGVNNSDSVTGFTQRGTPLIGGGTAEETVRLDGTEYVDVLTNLNTGNYSSDGGSTTLFRIPMNVPFGSVVFERSTTQDFIFVSSGSMNNFSMRLRDANGNPFELPKNSDVSVTLILSPIY